MPFDLISRPWLPVVDLKGVSGDVSLRDLLLGAHEFRRIVGETPPMTAALHRLVLAVIHRAYQPIDRDVWACLWRAESLPPDPLEDYFDKHRLRFDLFHPEWPFLQHTGVSAGNKSSPASLVAYRAAKNNPTLFDHTTAADRVELEPAEAARWLVTLQAYDTGGTKSPSEAGNQGTKYSIQGLCNAFGVCLVEGRTLKETLLLNTLRYDPEMDQPTTTTGPADRPVWEEPEQSGTAPIERLPRGWTDVLTWPSRRVWLSATQRGSGTVVDQVVITPGTRLDVPPGTRLDARLYDAELMAAFHRPARSSGQEPSKPSKVIQLEQLRGIWRHSVELLLPGDRHRQRPLTLDHIAEMAWAEHIPEGTVYTLRVFGQQLDDSGGGSVVAWLEEAVPAPVALLRASREELGPIIGAAVKLATDVGDALVKLGQGHRDDLSALKSIRPKLRSQVAADLELAYWPRLSKPFGEFLVALGDAYRTHSPQQPTIDAVETWSLNVRRIARRTAEQWTEVAPSRGRALLSLGSQHAQFLDKLDKRVKTFRVTARRSIAREETA